MVSFGALVVAYGGCSWPPAIAGAKQTFLRCCQMGGKWAWKDPFSGLMLVRQVKHTYKETFERKWSKYVELTKAAATGPVSPTAATAPPLPLGDHPAPSTGVEPPAAPLPLPPPPDNKKNGGKKNKVTNAETPPEKAKQSPLQELTRKAKALQTALKAERAVASDLIERTAAQPQAYKCLNNEWGVGELKSTKPSSAAPSPTPGTRCWSRT
jgi:hypothetical protein